MRRRSYSELKRIDTFDERYHYLRVTGDVGCATFGFDRWANQRFYTSREWRQVRFEVIARDNGCDLGIEGYDIYARILIHHMNPITPDDIFNFNEDILNPEYLITTTHGTHNAIHFGDERLLPRPFVPRTRGDTKLW